MRWVNTTLMITPATWLLYGSLSSSLAEGGNLVLTNYDLFYLLLIGLCASIYFTTAVTTTTIDKLRQTLTVKKKGLLKNSFSSYRFSEIDGFPFVEQVMRGRGWYYTIQLRLKTGEIVELADIAYFKKKYYAVVDRATKFMFDGPSEGLFKLTILDDY
jgi:hypothetical protein